MEGRRVKARATAAAVRGISAAKAARLPPMQRRALYGLVAVSWTSGTAYFLLDRWGQVEGEFGPERHPWLPALLGLHGAAAFLAMVAFGYLLASHVRPGWSFRRLRPLGLTVLVALALMILTGYLLYYLADETARAAAAWVHTGAGAALPLLLAAHLFQVARIRRRKRER